MDRRCATGGKRKAMMLTQVTSPQKIFFAPQRLVVPLFQRPYVWSKDNQWEPLWDDVLRLVEMMADGDQRATHFLGAVVLQSQEAVAGTLAVYTVIDGQQRLTTLQIFLDALHAQLEEAGLSALAGQVLALVENPEAFRAQPEDRFKVWPTNRDRPAFSAAMSAEAPVDHGKLIAGRLVDAHAFFSDAIRSWFDAEPQERDARAALLVQAVTSRLQLVSIELQSHEDAQEIFETLNARGTPLTAADLIKNFIFQRFEGDAIATERAYQENWSEFETPFWEAEVRAGRIRYARSSLFLTQWLTARTLKEIPAREVFSQFKRYVGDTKAEVLPLLRSIGAAAAKYRAFTEGAAVSDGSLSRTDRFVYRLDKLDSEIAKPLLIWLAEPEQSDIDEPTRNELLEALESWFVRRALVRAQSQGTNRLMLDLLVQLSRRESGQNVAAIAVDFLVSQTSPVGYWPDDAEVRRELQSVEAYKRFRRGRLLMVLEAIEDDQRGFTSGNPRSISPITRGVSTIEHVMPQEWRANWNDGLDLAQEASRDRLIHTIGNLTLVTSSLNARLSNAAWLGENGKREALRRSDTLLLGRDVVDVQDESWSDAHIQERSTRLIDAVLAIWPVPDGHTSSTEPSAARAQYKVEMADLIRAGLVTPGAVLYAKPAVHRGRTAVVNADGSVLLDGTSYSTVSGAARQLQGGGSVAGWYFWAIDPALSRTLADVRSTYAGATS